ncbi:MAG: PD-(D/E)XK nuclease family protein [Gammaproteobacteria bacterium]|nr:PD-(D/E)XK nuclease family protein [Gammaproteobacteria bacterium]MYK45245.1 PD-(D/E)XK nuclease family protein [Gammaproteobacteria bacterium]
MRVRFGLHRDALEPSLPRTTVGEITVGPLGFLGLLESDLGIAPVASHPSESIAAYRACLAECDDWVRFYHRSFDVDPVGVARTLNDWRQRWYLYGWDGRFPDQVGGRLGDMEAVESLAAERVSPGVGQRLRAVLALLDKRTQVAEVELLDDAHDLPPLWRRVLERFNCSTTPPSTGHAPWDSDLGKLQALLTRNQARPLDGDGSLIVVRAFSRDVTAQAAAEMLRQLDDPSRAVVVASRDGIILDNALRRVGLPRAGIQHYSPFRAASQVLKLAFALIWQPLDPHRLLQFLIHPVNPLPWRVRGRLAAAVASQPGIGGPAWQEAIAKIDDDQTDGVEFWTAPKRYDANRGAPVGDLHARASRAVAWLAARLATADVGEQSAVFSAAYSQAAALTATLRRLGDSGRQRISKIELDSLIDEATRSTPDASVVAEAGHVPVTSHPSNVTEATDEVFWWDLAPQRPDLTSPWSKEERDSLAAGGVGLPTPEDQLAADKRAWLRPVLNCRKRLVLVVHEDDEGRHPLWGRIREQIRRGWVDVPLDEILLRGKTTRLDQVAIPAPPLERKPLPVPRRWWRLDQPLPVRDSESYTSLNKTCYYPHEWVLTYAARLRSGGINEVADGAMLKGSLAHRLFERFFTEHGDWRSLGDHDIQKWLDTTIRDLIEKEGAVLLENGRGVDRQQVTTTLEHALVRLLGHLRTANVDTVKSEQAVQRSFPGGVLYGEADLVVVGPGDSEAVLDAKWGSERYREEEIEGGRHLQLAVYGYALGDKAWPSTGYYIVTTGNVVAPDADFFPKALAAGGEPVEAVWRKSLVTRNWRLEQFARGEIEVNADAKPDAASEPPEGGLESRIEPDRFDDFRWLTGVAPFR